MILTHDYGRNDDDDTNNDDGNDDGYNKIKTGNKDKITDWI